MATTTQTLPPVAALISAHVELLAAQPDSRAEDRLVRHQRALVRGMTEQERRDTILACHAALRLCGETV